jgi:high-affinity nickel-transport protein
VELLGLLAQQLNFTGAFWSWVSGLNLNTVGFVIVGLFIATWVVALAVWKFGRIEERWETEALADAVLADAVLAEASDLSASGLLAD